MSAETETRTGHAPGPWKVDTTEREMVLHKEACIKSPNYHIALVHGGHGHLQDTARLIAAAPELLEAAERVLRNIEHPADEFNPPAVRDLRTAIAKAKGGPDA